MNEQKMRVQAALADLKTACHPAMIPWVVELQKELDLELDQLRQRVAEVEAQNNILRGADYHQAGIQQENEIITLEAKLALADKWTRAWRNRFIDERMNAYPKAGYEMKRCYAETDANDFEAAFNAAIASHREGQS